MKQKLRSGDEYDLVSKRWRRMVFWQRGETKKVKRRLHKRLRREARDEIRKEVR